MFQSNSYLCIYTEALSFRRSRKEPVIQLSGTRTLKDLYLQTNIFSIQSILLLNVIFLERVDLKIAKIYPEFVEHGGRQAYMISSEAKMGRKKLYANHSKKFCQNKSFFSSFHSCGVNRSTRAHTSHATGTTK